MLKTLASAIFSAGVATSAALAQANYPVKIYPDDHGPLAIDTLYAIETHCAPGPMPFPSSVIPGPLSNSSEKLSHAVVVSTGNVNGAVNLASLSASVVSVAVPYSVDTAFAAANQQNSFQGCDANYLIEGPVELYVTAIYGESSTTNPGAIADAFQSFVSVVTSLAPVVTGATLGPNAAKALSGVEGALPPLTKLFQDLFPSNGATYQRTLRLRIGNTSVATQFSTTGVTVRPIKSVVFDDQNPDRPYFKSFTKVIDDLKIAGSLDENTCQGIKNNLAQAGFKSPDDQAYALGRLALKNNAHDRATVAECLGNLCPTAIAPKMDAVLWNEGAVLRPTASDCNDIIAPGEDQSPLAQPPWSSVGPILKDLAILYGQYSADAPPPAAFSQFTETNVSNPVSLVDKTSYSLFGATTAMNVRDLFNFLKSKSFLRLGCWAGIDDPVMFYGSRASIVSAKVPKVGASASVADTIAVFPFWSDGKISKLVVSDDAGDISTTIGKLTSCGGFTVSTK
jgi:hypothetical protein